MREEPPPRADRREADETNPIDRSLKALIRHAYPAFFRLAGLQLPLASLQVSDTAINLPEHRADHVFFIDDEDDLGRWALYLEYQLEPDLSLLPTWFYKTGALTRQLRCPVVLVAAYLMRGDRATFPASYTVTRVGVMNEFRFHTVRLWEHAEAIRRGDFPELAPLLVLCEDKPTEETLRREREIILGLDVDPTIRIDLLAIASLVGTRFFARSLVLSLFREEIKLMKEDSLIHDIFQEEIEEIDTQGARRFLLRLLQSRFGELPDAAIERVEHADRAWCEETGERLLHAQSLEDLGLTDNGTARPSTPA